MIKNISASLKPNQRLIRKIHAFALVIGYAMTASLGCRNTEGGQSQQGGAPVAQAYPVLKVTTHSTTLQSQYPATLKDVQNIEIRPKIDEKKFLRLGRRRRAEGDALAIDNLQLDPGIDVEAQRVAKPLVHQLLVGRRK